MNKKHITVLTPSDFTNEPILAKERSIRKYEKEIDKRIAKYIDILKFGLSYYGIKAELNPKYPRQIDFRDKDDQIIYRKKFLYPKTKTDHANAIIDSSLNQISIRFNIEEGYMFCCAYTNDDRDIYKFELNDGLSIKSLTLITNQEKFLGAEVNIYGGEDFGEKTIDIFDNIYNQRLVFDLDDAYSTYRRHKRDELGPLRRVEYNFWYQSMKRHQMKVSYHESFGSPNCCKPKDATICAEQEAFGGDISKIDQLFSWRNVILCKAKDKNIIAHPRSKETIKYTEEAIDKEFPGIINFFRNTFELYRRLTNLEYVSLEEYENTEFLEECNFDNITKTR